LAVAWRQNGEPAAKVACLWSRAAIFLPEKVHIEYRYYRLTICIFALIDNQHAALGG
jgi:hypothetical protein